MFLNCGLKKPLESPLDSKEIKPVNPKEISPEYSLEEQMLKLQYFGHLISKKSWLFGKDSDAGKDWEQEKWVTEDEMVGWHHWPNGHESEQTQGDSEGQGKPGMLQFMGSQRIGHNLKTEQQHY